MDIFFSFVIIILTLFFLYYFHKKVEKEDYNDCLEGKSSDEIFQCFLKKSENKNINLATLHKISVEALLKKIA
jgi:uncharacterized ion transporter superfamily protein YfcC